jgi:hypothetical protein
VCGLDACVVTGDVDAHRLSDIDAHGNGQCIYDRSSRCARNLKDNTETSHHV